MLNIVHVGFGYWGTNVVRNIIASEKTNLVAICDISQDRLNSARMLYGKDVDVTDNFDKYLNDPNVDAFSLAIQTEPSYEIALKIMGAGKHLFIEKPIATNAERAENLNNFAKSHGLTLHCDHIMIYHPIIRYIKKLYDGGELGDIIYFDVSRMNLGPIRKDVNSMLDLAVHDLAVIDYLSNGSEPIQVYAMGEKKYYGNQETLTYLTMEYNGFIAHIKSSWISPIKERRMIIGFTKKMVIFNDMESVEKLKIYNHGFIQRNGEYGSYEFKARTGEITSPYIQQEDALRNSINHFADCVKEGKESLSNGDQGVKVAKILDQANASLARLK
jgi:predicted dehydrogenase